MPIEIRLLAAGDEPVLTRVAPEVFDHPVHAPWAAEFLQDPRHHLAVAVDAGQVVGFASAIHYIHPDKPPELWVNEVSVAPSHWHRGLGSGLLRALFEAGGRERCVQAWVLTNRTNGPAMRLYASAGGTEAREDAVMFTFSLETDDER